MAQRMMDSGYDVHILLSNHVSENLEEYEQWRPLLHDLGACEVKHGVRVSVVNLYTEQFGNATLPRKFEAVQKRRMRLRWTVVTSAFLGLAPIIPAFSLFRHHPP